MFLLTGHILKTALNDAYPHRNLVLVQILESLYEPLFGGEIDLPACLPTPKPNLNYYAKKKKTKERKRAALVTLWEARCPHG